MSKEANKDAKKSQVEEVNPEVIEDEEADSPWYYFYSQGCGWCKKSEPIVDELNKNREEGQEILKLDLADPDNRALNEELKQEYGIQCGTPWLINEATGKGICGFREKDIVQKWLDGEDIPAPPRPKGPIPKIPLLGASDKVVNKWKKDYKKWLKENDHLPDNQKRTAEQILSQPRPKSEPPTAPNPTMTDEQLDKWGEEYDKWKEENSHLPNLQPGSVIVQRLKSNRPQNNQPAANVPNQAVNDEGKINSIDARIQALEVKLDKVIKHFGIG